MDIREQEQVVSRLNGYVMAMSFVDGRPGDSVADAYMAELDEDDLLGSLAAHVRQEPENQYVYDVISEIRNPWSKPLVVTLDGFFFKRPFLISSNAENAQIKSTREQMVNRIIHLVGVLTDNFSCEKIYRAELHSNDGYAGHMHLLPLARGFLVLKTISRI